MLRLMSNHKRGYRELLSGQNCEFHITWDKYTPEVSFLWKLPISYFKSTLYTQAAICNMIYDNSPNLFQKGLMRL